MRRCLNWVPPAIHVSNNTWLLWQKMEGNYSNAQFNCSFSTKMGPFSLCVESRPQEGKSVSKETPCNRVRWRREMNFWLFIEMGLWIHSYQSRHRQTTSATAKLKIQTVINSKWFLGAGMNHCPYNVRSQSFLALLLLTTQERKLSSSFPVISKLLVLLPFLKIVSQIITPDTLYVRSSWSLPPFTKNEIHHSLLLSPFQ